MKEPISYHNLIPILAFLIAIWVILLIPFQVVGYGFMPPDDANRHSAKVISGKDWGQILVLRDEIKVDSYPGWHAILGFFHKAAGWDQHDLVIFSVISLFVFFALVPVFFLQYPESWLISLTAVVFIKPGWTTRLFEGRPYIFTMASLLLILFIWPSFKNKKKQFVNFIILTMITALSVWIHASWYFFFLVALAFILAREWRASVLIIISSIVGIFLGASFTGHPILFLKQEILHLIFVFTSHDAERLLVSELRPAIGDPLGVFAALMVLGWRGLRGKRVKTSVDNPVFILAALCFVLCFLSKRIWIDWGIAAFVVWIAKEIDEFLESTKIAFARQRLALILASTVIFYLAFTTDVSSRWSLSRTMDYISMEDKEQAGWLPEPGGIIYSDDMCVFYQIFYKNPKAPWRYILGFESAFMPPEDLKILRNIQRNFSCPKDYDPWVRKMTPKDRLIIRGAPGNQPKITGLEWHYIALNTWSGKKPEEKNR